MTAKKKYGLVHCHYDKRSKGRTSAIGILEKKLILPKFAHSISMIKACLSMLVSIILSVSSFHALLSPSLEVKGQYSHVYSTGYHISHVSKLFHTKICVHRL